MKDSQRTYSLAQYGLGDDAAMTLGNCCIKVYADDASRTSIANAKVTCAAKTYNGSAQNPSITVTYNGKTLCPGTDYRATTVARKAVGVTEETIVGLGDYASSKTFKFKISPKPVVVTAATAGKGKLKVRWNRLTKTTASGYRLYYRTAKDKSYKKVTLKGYKHTSAILKKLKGKKTYYITMRAYKVVKGVSYYSRYSKVFKRTTK
jgi:hypothetical protein